MLDGKHFIPWTTDARQLLSGKSGDNRRTREWIRKLLLVSTAGLRDFESGLPIVASPRGHGKSAIVARHAVRLLDTPANYIALRDVSPFVSELASASITIPPKQSDSLISSYRWATLWRCTLLAHVACMVLRQRNVLIATDSDDEAKRTLTLHQHFLASTIQENNAPDQLTYSNFVQQVWAESLGHIESRHQRRADGFLDRGLSKNNYHRPARNSIFNFC
jgi:hypothetical protein